VFGWLSGIGAKDYINSLSSDPQIDEAQIENARAEAVAPLNREKGENPYLIHEKLQTIMNDNVNIVRTASDLQTGIEEIEKLKSEIANVKANGSSQYNPGWHEALSLKAMILVSEAVARAALIREESRGAHTRIDFEGEQKEWEIVEIIAKKQNGKLEVQKQVRPEPPKELADIAYATLEELEKTND